MNNTIKLLAIILPGLLLSQFTLAGSQANVIQDAVNNPARSDADRKRDETSKPAEIMKFFDVKPGMQILDFLSGGGYYSEVMSYVVGDKGQVTAHTNEAYNKFVGDGISKRYGGDRLAGVKRLITEMPALELGKDSFDMILMVMTYHDVYYVADYWPAVDRENFFRQIHAALKPGGTLAIIDHSAVAGTGKSAAQDLHRVDEEFAKADIESAGFSFQASSDVLRNADDDRTVQVFDESIRRKSDRFVHHYIKKEPFQIPPVIER